MADKKLTASQIAKDKTIPVKQVFQQLLEKGFVERQAEQWVLTQAGKEAGGEKRTSKKFGEFLVWPAAIISPGNEEGSSDESEPKKDKKSLLNSTRLGKHFNMSPTSINRILNEIGWIDKAVKGWKITSQGKAVGGQQREHHQSGVPFVVWPEDILTHDALKQRAAEEKGDTSSKQEGSKSETFRERFPASHRTADGHYVRSRAEMLIDNWLYMNELVHAYERKLPIEEEVYSDFYIPTGKVYIEFWGMENDSNYVDRKNQKIGIYRKYGFKLIELKDEDIANLDDVLPRELLRFEIQTF